MRTSAQASRFQQKLLEGALEIVSDHNLRSASYYDPNLMRRRFCRLIEKMGLAGTTRLRPSRLERHLHISKALALEIKGMMNGNGTEGNYHVV